MAEADATPRSGIHALIVDDELIARRGVRRALDAMTQITAISECANGLEAIDRITSDPPDVVILDVQMPVVSGLEVVRRVGVARMPPVVFVTAHDTHAISAFELAAVDYVLKPYMPERLQAAVQRAVDRKTERTAARILGQVIESMREPLEPSAATERARAVAGSSSFLRRILATAGRRGIVVPVNDIIWIQADDYCATLITAKGRAVIRESLTELEARLDPEHFLRVHRSALVRLDAVRGIRRQDSTLQLELADGTLVPVARARIAKVLAVLGGTPEE